MEIKNLPVRMPASCSRLSQLECPAPVPLEYIEQALQVLARATACRQVAELVIEALAAGDFV
jgi:hypothetical protein